MRMVDLICRKKYGEALTDEEIETIVAGYTKGTIPDYQMSAFLMAVYFRGMTDRELVAMTLAMRDSGSTVDLSGITGTKVDKHSTGGVGDKTTLVVAPVVAACGGHVAKMSGRGLGFTGGTIDKLESIPGFRTDIPMDAFIENVNRIGVSVMGQTADLAPADKKIYALRDVTGIVDSIPLIASSIMSKKLASGSDRIILDVTVGSGAFMKDEESARTLAQKMVRIGNMAGKPTEAVLSDMDEPLGQNVGNALEVIEAIETLKGRGPADLREICRVFAGHMIAACGIAEEPYAEELADQAIRSGRALEKFRELIRAQGGDSDCVDDYSAFKQPLFRIDFTADACGFITHMNTELCGAAAGMLGAGRESLQSAVDPSAGIVFRKKTGDSVRPGEVIAELCTDDRAGADSAAEVLREAISIGADRPAPRKKILGVIRE